MGHEPLRQQIVDDLRAWESMDSHRTATPGDADTTAWLLAEATKVGIAGQADSFTVNFRRPVEAYVQIGQKRIEGVPLYDGGETPPGGISGELGREIHLTSHSPSDQHPATQALHEERTQGNYPGVVSVAADPNIVPGLTLINAESSRKPFGPPVLQVGTEHEPTLRDADGGQVKLVVRFEAQARPATNVVLHIAGDSRLAPVVIMTPKSSWWTSTAERGGGLVAWLACMRELADSAPDRPVHMLASTGHELSHLGLHHYLNEHPALLSGAHAWVHLGANFIARNGRVSLQAGPEDDLARLYEAFSFVEETQLIHREVGQRPFGEAREIFDAGGRYLSVLGTNPWFHHPDDTLDTAVDLDKAVHTTEAILTIVRNLCRA